MENKQSERNPIGQVYMGIDPGSKGGIAIINIQKTIVFEMPLLTNGEIDIRKIVDAIDKYPWEIDFCFIEKAQTMSKQGVKSTFNYGKGYGMLRAALDIFGIPYQEIHPMKWKKEFSLIKTTKDDSISVARKLFPNLGDDVFVTPRGRKKDGNAEALLIAEFCRRSMG